MRTQTVTILFCDLVASTERRARLGDDEFDAFTVRFLAALRDAIAEHHGQETLNAGDGLMVVFSHSVADGVACASTMHRTVRHLDPTDPALLRIGISSGEVATDGDEYSGMPIVEAARLEAAAAPGQTLANAVVRSLVGTRRALRFRDVGALTLKGIPAPLAAVEVIDERVVDEPLPAPAPAPKATPSRRRRPFLVAAGVVVAVVALVGAGLAVTRSGDHDNNEAAPSTGVPAPRGYTPRYQNADCPADVRNVAVDATCGHLTVPQDRGKPDGKHVTLLVTRAPPRRSGALGPPTIDICGCENVGNSLARDHSELIHVGQRGYDGTPTLTCPEFVEVRLQALTKRSDDRTANSKITDALGRCHKRLTKAGIDPAQYNFNTAAQDVLDLMWVLGIQHANLIAWQQVSAEAFAVLRRAPGAIRSMTLDNPPPPGETLFSDPIGDLAGAFHRFVEQCEANRACATAYPDLEGKLRAAYAAADAHPMLVSTPNPYADNAPPLEVLLDGPREADALGAALEDATTYGAIPSAIVHDSEPLFAAIVLKQDRLTPDAPWGGQASYYCSYDIHTTEEQGQALAAQTLPEFVRAHDAHWAQWCKGWSVPDVSDQLSADIVADVPVLAFRGNLTPDGNPDWLPRIERGFSAMQVVIFPTLGSDLLATGPACLSDLRRAFLLDPTKKLDTASCAKRSERLDFVIPSS